MVVSSNSYTFEHLELNAETFNREFQLPIDIINGQLTNMRVEFPWSQLFRTANVVAEKMGKLNTFPIDFIGFFRRSQTNMDVR